MLHSHAYLCLRGVDLCVAFTHLFISMWRRPTCCSHTSDYNKALELVHLGYGYRVQPDYALSA
uniref:Uncharacterized protein n=1 Tax=Cannabis sativa TaxID=3483 RepID=A0A803QT91_CANSA